jgi:hypothetical protein
VCFFGAPEDSFGDASALGLHISVVRILAESGILETRMDEFGEMQVALVSSEVRFTNSCRSSRPPDGVIRLPLSEHIESHHKLELVMELQRSGWVQDFVVDQHGPDAEKKFSLPMVSRSKLYFACLIRASDVWKRGGTCILANMPEGYYKCVLQLESLAVLVAIGDEDGLNNKKAQPNLNISYSPWHVSIDLDPLGKHVQHRCLVLEVQINCPRSGLNSV